MQAGLTFKPRGHNGTGHDYLFSYDCPKIQSSASDGHSVERMVLPGGYTFVDSSTQKRETGRTDIVLWNDEESVKGQTSSNVTLITFDGLKLLDNVSLEFEALPETDGVTLTLDQLKQRGGATLKVFATVSAVPDGTHSTLHLNLSVCVCVCVCLLPQGLYINLLIAVALMIQCLCLFQALGSLYCDVIGYLLQTIVLALQQQHHHLLVRVYTFCYEHC